jgi:hypothetical protein
VSDADAFAFGFGLAVGCAVILRALTSRPTAAESWLWAHAEGRA